MSLSVLPLRCPLLQKRRHPFLGIMLQHVLGHHVDSPVIGANFDTGNAYLCGQDPVVWLEKILDKVVHVHAKDISMQQSSAERGKVTGTPVGCACGEGVVDWAKVIEVCKKSKRDLVRLDDHTKYIMDVAWSPDGRWIASGSGDNTAKIWDVASGTMVLGPFAHSHEVTSIAWHPEGQTLATFIYEWGLSRRQRYGIASAASFSSSSASAGRCSRTRLSPRA